MTTLNIVLIIGCIVVITFSLALIIHTFILTKLNKHAIDDFSLEINDISNEFYDEFNKLKKDLDLKIAKIENNPSIIAGENIQEKIEDTKEKIEDLTLKGLEKINSFL